MNTEMAYLLGMITGNGKIQRGNIETTVVIDIPHKKLKTEFNDDVNIYVRASITDIRTILDPLLGTSLMFSQTPNLSILSFVKPNSDYTMREILRLIGMATSSDNIRISPDVFAFSNDERKNFIRGFADVTGYIRRSNYFFNKYDHRVYFEIPQNWELVVDFCNLLKSVDVPVCDINWAHPNMRDGNLKDYNSGKVLSWKKEHQIKVWALEYQPIGFAIIHKQEALDSFSLEQEKAYVSKGIDARKHLHKYYWELRRRQKKRLSHPSENDKSIPLSIRGNHYESWKDIANDLGYNEDS